MFLLFKAWIANQNIALTVCQLICKTAYFITHALLNLKKPAVCTTCPTGEAPDTKTEKHTKKFIAAIFVPIMFG